MRVKLHQTRVAARGGETTYAPSPIRDPGLRDGVLGCGRDLSLLREVAVRVKVP